MSQGHHVSSIACPHCQKEVTSTAPFCPACGEPLDPGAEARSFDSLDAPSLMPDQDRTRVERPDFGDLVPQATMSATDLPQPTVDPTTIRPMPTIDTPELMATLALPDSARDMSDPAPSGGDAHENLRRNDAPYERGSLLGRGGMGEVTLVHDVDLERDVVMKTLLPGNANERKSLRRFVEEARVTGQLEHPNIVPIHDLGETEDGMLFFTMKRVKGEDLSKLIRRFRDGDDLALERFPLSRRLEIFLAVCNGVGFAHAKGVVHRDLKPENIMLGDFGEVLVMDWGLAKRLGRADSTSSELDATVLPMIDDGEGSGLTLDGQILGTPSYMSPEQARGDTEATDSRSDIYALGAILHELLCFRRAFQAKNLMLLLDKVATNKYTPAGQHRRDPDVPRELTAVVVKALQPDPDDRYQSTQALANDVRAYLDGRALQAADYTSWQLLSKWVARNRMAVAAGIVAVAALIGGAYASYVHQQESRRHQAADMFDTARDLFRERKYDKAQQEAIGVIALGERHPGVVELIERAGQELDRQRQRAEKEQVAAELAAPLREAVAAAAALGEMRTADPGEWYTLHGRALQAARDLVRRDPDGKLDVEARSALVTSALALAHRLATDGNAQLARVMLDEAREAGLDSEQLETASWLVHRAGAQAGRESAIEGRRLLDQVGAGKLDEAAAIDRVLALSRDARLTREMIRAALDTNESTAVRRTAIEALGRLGDTSTSLRIRDRASLKAMRKNYWGRVPAREGLMAGPLGRYSGFVTSRIMRLGADPVRALMLIVLDDPGPLVIEATQACGRLGDARAAGAIAIKRFAFKDGHALRAHAERALGRLEDPEHSLPTGAFGELIRGMLAEARGQSRDAVQHYEAARGLEDGGGYFVPVLKARAMLPVDRDAGLALLARITRDAIARSGDRRDPKSRRIRSCARLSLHLEGTSLLAVGRGEEALDRFTRSIRAYDRASGNKNTPASMFPYEIYLGRAEALRMLDRREEALRIVDKVLLRAGGRVLGSYLLQARLLSELDRPDDAIKALDLAVGRDASSAEALLLRGQVRVQRGDAAGGVADATLALRHDPLLARAWLLRGSARLQRALGGSPADIDAARIDLVRYTELAPDDLEGQLRLGHVELIAKRYTVAITALTRAVEGGHSEGQARKLRGVARALDGDPLAAEDLQRAMELLPRDPIPLLFLAQLSRVAGKLDQARALIGRAQTLDPKHPELHYQAAMIAMATGDPATVLKALERAVRFGKQGWTPNSHMAAESLTGQLLMRATMHARAGRNAEAIADLQRAEVVAPTQSPQRQRIVDMLRKLGAAR